jgi:RNA polymerase sigma-70 factor (ECF subfamily)
MGGKKLSRSAVIEHTLGVERAKPRAVPDPPNDAELVERIRNKDEKAFKALYQRYARYIAGVVYRLLGVDEALDDMVQETFIDAADGIAKLREPEKVRSWLATIAVRHTKRYLARKIRRRQVREEVKRAEPRTDDPRDREMIQGLYRALDTLPVKQRIPWILHRVEGHTLPEVAKMCSISLATVKRRIAGAEERLQRRLEDG